MPDAPDARHFDRVAPVYDRGRPAYPGEVYELLEAHGLLAPGARVLEVGAGSGQATAELVARGATVDAIEPSPSLAEALRELDGVTVHETTAEEWPPLEAAYDGIVAATSLHWVDVSRVLPGWHRALRPGGLVAVWWAVFGDPGVRTPFRERLDRIARDTGRHRGSDDRPRPLRTQERVAELEAGGLFRCVSAAVLPWPVRQTPEDLRALFTTFPTWGEDAEVLDAVEAAARECAASDGTVEEHYLLPVYLARHSSASNA